MIFLIFWFFCTLRFQIFKYCPNHASMEILFIQLSDDFWPLWLVLCSRVTHLILTRGKGGLCASWPGRFWERWPETPAPMKAWRRRFQRWWAARSRTPNSSPERWWTPHRALTQDISGAAYIIRWPSPREEIMSVCAERCVWTWSY